jgi:hypothetical protein
MGRQQFCPRLAMCPLVYSGIPDPGDLHAAMQPTEQCTHNGSVFCFRGNSSLTGTWKAAEVPPFSKYGGLEWVV